MKLSVNAACPCGSNKKYKKCCLIFHKGAHPSSALLLMKSRFSAFAANQSTYIIKTTHHENSDFTEDLVNWKASILDFCHNTEFVKLEILEFKDGEEEAFVTFKASLKQHAEDTSFVEKSRFLKENGIWLYHSGVFE